MYSLGRKEYGRLGHGEDDLEEKEAPTLIPTLKDEICTHVDCGTAVSFAVTNKGNTLEINHVILGPLSGFPQGLENRENREQNNGQGKVREFYFGPKVREFCFKLPIAMKICCYSCRLSRMFVPVFTNMKVHM